ncbi:MAG: hypothetical protein K2M56_09730 [Muribaculaceae bacterium]|nr:hypothetical protein [Muribaculaceae bacterium]
MTLLDRYQNAKNQARPLSPAAAFIREVAEVTKKSEIAIRRWLSGECEPDELTKTVLAQHFNTTPEELFPKR